MKSRNCIYLYVSDEEMKEIEENAKKENIPKTRYVYQMYLKALNMDTVLNKLANMEKKQNDISSLLKKNYAFQKYHFACEKFRESVDPNDCELINEFSRMKILKPYD